MEKYELDKAEQTKKFTLDIMRDHYKYMQETLPSKGVEYQAKVDELKDNLFVKRTVGILTILYETAEYNNPESQEKVQQNSEKLQNAIDGAMKDYVFVASGESKLLDKHFSPSLMEQLEKANGKVALDLENSAETVVDNYQKLSESSSHQAVVAVKEADEELFKELGIDKKSELGKTITEKVSKVEKEFFDGLKQNNSIMFGNFSSMLTTFKMYIKSFIVAAQYLAMISPKKEEVATTNEKVEVNNTDFSTPQEVVSFDELGAMPNDLSVMDAIHNKIESNPNIEDSYLQSVSTRKAL